MTTSPELDELRARLLRIEEAQAFAEHTTDQLHQQVLSLHQRVHDLVARIQRFESRLGDVGDLVQRLARSDAPAPADQNPPDPMPPSDEQ